MFERSGNSIAGMKVLFSLPSNAGRLWQYWVRLVLSDVKHCTTVEPKQSRVDHSVLKNEQEKDEKSKTVCDCRRVRTYACCAQRMTR